MTMHPHTGWQGLTPDRHLVERMARGEALAFHELLRRHGDSAYALAFSILLDSEDAMPRISLESVVWTAPSVEFSSLTRPSIAETRMFSVAIAALSDMVETSLVEFGKALCPFGVERARRELLADAARNTGIRRNSRGLD